MISIAIFLLNLNAFAIFVILVVKCNYFETHLIQESENSEPSGVIG